ncbi:MAG: right-handed parallel beta-helix repeat-containing protein [Polyangiaceae bacterium]
MKPTKRLFTLAWPPYLRLWLLAAAGAFVSRDAFAADYYVATTGSDSDPGTITQPFASLQKGADVAAAGDTVWLRGGTYNITTAHSSSAGIEISTSGTSDTNRINFFAYPGETPLIDFSQLPISTTDFTDGIVVTGSWLHFRGISECCVPMNTFSNNGWEVDNAANDIFELLDMYGNSGNGIFVSHGTGGHLILNCDGHDNYDATSSQGQGQNADGFGVHYQTTGATTVIRGCRSWWNSDDGIDLINQEVPVTVENSWAFGNGYANYGTYSPTSGNGNGFKMGSSKTGIRHLVQNNVAWKNKANGFYANHSSGGNTWYNNTSFQNGTQYNMLASTWSEPNGGGTRTDGVILTGTKVHIMRNNIGYPDKNEYITGYGVDSQFNTWDLNITPGPTDFLSIADPSVNGTGASIETSGALGPRAANGDLPDVDFLQLAAGSQMIDKGTDVGLPYVGAAPDLGAYEFGAGPDDYAGGDGGAGTPSDAGGGTGSSSGAASSSGGALSSSSGAASSSSGALSSSSGAASSSSGATSSSSGISSSSGGIRASSSGGASASSGGTASSSGGASASSGAVSASSGGGSTSGGLGSSGGFTGSSTSSGVSSGSASSSSGVTTPGGSSGVGVSSSGGTQDGGLASPAGDTTGAGSSAGGCGCRAAPSPSRGAYLGALGLAGLSLVRRRRNRPARDDGGRPPSPPPAV